MNRQDPHNFDSVTWYRCNFHHNFYHCNDDDEADVFYSTPPVRSMHQVGLVTMSSSLHDVSDLSNDRLAHSSGSHPNERSHPQDLDFLSTASGDVVYVQPSFDDSIDKPRSPKEKVQERQARSPQQEGQHGGADVESRNPCSPEKIEPHRQQGHHARNLSAHFFDAAALSPHADDMDDGVLMRESHLEQRSNRQHRRLMSDDLLSNPPMAHRRINSSGMSVAIERDQAENRHHQRVDSAGLDILSAAVDVSKDELAQAAGAVAVQNREAPWGSPPGTTPPISSAIVQGVHYDHHAPYGPHPGAIPNQHMNPPHRRLPSYPHPYPVPPYHGTPQPYSPSHYPPYVSSSYYVPSYSAHHRATMPPPPPPTHYPVQYSRPTVEVSNKASLTQSRRKDDRKAAEKALEEKGSVTTPTPNKQSGVGSNHQGSQTFVTAIATGPGNRAMQPSNAMKHASTNTDDYALSSSSVPSQVGHHRKLSSFSSLGTIVASSVFSPVPEKSTGSHHRATSSSISFFQGMDVALESTDETFLRNLQASNSAPEFPDPPRSYGDSHSDVDDESVNGNKLASGGTSKRIRRKCSIEGCANRVVQGGLCIAHGAKRKLCKFPGCTKNVKKAGLCSTHGPARRRCDTEGCFKVAVQGGRCISHGAKKRACSVEGCGKQAIVAGMCKKHHDTATLEGGEIKSEDFCQSVETSPSTITTPTPTPATTGSHRPSHTRGLSIFQDLSADDVQSLLGHEGNHAEKSTASIRTYGV